MSHFFDRLIALAAKVRLRFPPAAPPDPYALTLAPLKPQPKGRSGAVAVAEPDEDR